MKRIRVEAKEGFRVLAGSERSQAATMVLAPEETTGGRENRHRDSDQWLFVLSGSGEAWVAGETVALVGGDLLLIEAGEPHEIRNPGAEPLVTLNLYAPPEY